MRGYLDGKGTTLFLRYREQSGQKRIAVRS